MLMVLPLAMTFFPIIAAPCITCMEVYCAAIEVMVVLSCWMPETVLICAIWLVICALSMGFMGSWLLSCATSSFRKLVDWSAALVEPRDDAKVPVLAAEVEVVDVTLATMVIP